MQIKLTFWFIISTLGFQTLSAADNLLVKAWIATSSAFTLVSAGVYVYDYWNQPTQTPAAEETKAIGELAFAQVDYQYTRDIAEVAHAPWHQLSEQQRKRCVLAQIAEGTLRAVPLGQQSSTTLHALESAQKFQGYNMQKRQLRVNLHDEDDHGMEHSVGPGASALNLPGLERHASQQR